MAETKKRERVFERSYSDKSGTVAIEHDGEEVASFNIADLSPAALTSMAMRYAADVLVAAANSARKAEGGTMEKGLAAVAETLKALKEGSYKFRAASGQGGLSVEDEQEVIIAEVVRLGYFADADSARAKVLDLYGQVTETKNGNKTRPAYNKIKNDPDIKLALAKASKQESGLSDLFGTKPE